MVIGERSLFRVSNPHTVDGPSSNTVDPPPAPREAILGFGGLTAVIQTLAIDLI